MLHRIATFPGSAWKVEPEGIFLSTSLEIRGQISLEANQHYSWLYFNIGNKLNFLRKTQNIKLITEAG